MPLGGTVHRKGGPDMAEINSPGGPLSAGDQIFRDRPASRAHTVHTGENKSVSKAKKDDQNIYQNFYLENVSSLLVSFLLVYFASSHARLTIHKVIATYPGVNIRLPA